MINVKQLRELVIIPTLKYLDPEIPYSEDAVELLLMTAAHESRLGTYLKQIEGPALGIYQMEPATYTDILDNFVQYRGSYITKLVNLSTSVQRGIDELVFNLAYATALARLHYYRVPEALPKRVGIKHPDQKYGWIKDMAVYAKRHFNTELGKATWEDYAEAYKELVLGEK